jgi:hypothetical protein
MGNPAGWYPQPDGRQRYWDGQEWTTAWAGGGEAVPSPTIVPMPSPAGSSDEMPVYNGASPSKISKRIVIGVVAAIVVIGSATGLALKVSHDNQVTAQRVAADQAQKRTADAASAAAAAKQAADDKTRADRQAQITQLEASILTDAKERVTSQTLTGPILSASCTPLGGGSSDDLTSVTGTFECIAVNKKNTDGSTEGYRFSATINWNKDYTWHLGN